MAADAMPTVDPLDRRSLPAILADLSSRRATGALAVLGGSGRRLMVFREGRLRAARSTFESERLGAWLAGRDRVREAQLALALLAQSGPDTAPIGRILVDRGLIDEPTLNRELEELGLVILSRATTEPRRQLSFDDGLDHHQPDTLPDHATARLILAAARMLDAEREMPRVLTDPGRAYRSAGAPSVLAARLNATPDERRVLHALALPHTLDDLGSGNLMPADALRRALLPLVLCGAVAPSGAVIDTPPTPRAGPPAAWSDAQLEERAIVARFMKETSERDHYAVLGLEAGASYTDIETAWTRLAARFDPTRTTRSTHLADLGNELSQAYERIRTAYETLIDPTSRVAYNRIHHAGQLQAGPRAASQTGTAGHTAKPGPPGDRSGEPPARRPGAAHRRPPHRLHPAGGGMRPRARARGAPQARPTHDHQPDVGRASPGPPQTGTGARPRLRRCLAGAGLLLATAGTGGPRAASAGPGP